MTASSAWYALRWLVWAAFGACWTVALLTPYPTQVSQAVLPAEARYPAAKTLHIGMYAAWTILSAGLPLRRGQRPWVVLLLILHGPFTEASQLWVPLRSGSPADVAYDLIGVGLGLILTAPWWLAAGPAGSEHAADHVAPAER